jgi:uncharacterized MAPEG superfamily protein
MSAGPLHLPALHPWIFALTALLVKMHCNSALQKLGRERAGAYPRPEDAALFGVRHADDTGLALRAGRCWQNDLENIPLFLFVSLAYVLVGGPGDWATVLFGTYVAARVGHTVCYLLALQPWRLICYAAGHVAQLAVLVMTIRETLPR